MQERYVIKSIGEFYEIFDQKEMQTVYASEEVTKVRVALVELRKHGKISEQIKRVK